MWLMEYRFDGLRFDAVHAISEQDWIEEMASAVSCSVEEGRQVHLILEHHNDADHLRQKIDAQWNDDAHNVLHVLLTDESGGYYADYANQPATKLARCLKEGWAYQGETSNWLGHCRGMPSADLPSTCHVLFLQNHDQIGNRAFGERLTTLTPPAALEAAIAAQLLCPQIPLIFMGEEAASRSPFLYFTDHKPELAAAVLDGRRNEFASFVDFSGDRELPDPNDTKTFRDCVPVDDPERGVSRREFYRNLISLRNQHITPGLNGTMGIDATVLGDKAVTASWRMGDGSVLRIFCNLGTEAVAFEPPTGRCVFATHEFKPGELPGFFTLCFLDDTT
jgi:malto-oligosyltrehalose trehalohydrolase